MIKNDKRCLFNGIEWKSKTYDFDLNRQDRASMMEMFFIRLLSFSHVLGIFYLNLMGYCDKLAWGESRILEWRECFQLSLGPILFRSRTDIDQLIYQSSGFRELEVNKTLNVNIFVVIMVLCRV